MEVKGIEKQQRPVLFYILQKTAGHTGNAVTIPSG